MEASPFTQCMDGLGLSPSALAMAADVQPPQISNARAGGGIPRRVIECLRTLGVDVDSLCRAQGAYRASEARRIRDSVRQRMASTAVSNK